ncbi:MAG: hypothetical protein ACRDSL_23460 [Pseudonocardiaceae bacterium]
MSDPPVVDSASSTDEIRRLFKIVTVFRDGTIDPEQVYRLHELCPSLNSWRCLISAIPRDKLSFHLEAGIQRAEAIRLLSKWCRSFAGSSPAGFDDGAAEIHGFLSVLLITLITIEEGALSSSGSRSDALDGKFREISDKRSMSRHNCEETCQALTRIPSVRSVLLDLYAPDDASPVPLSPVDREQQKNAVAGWNRLQADSLRFHRHGSTSFNIYPCGCTQGRLRVCDVGCARQRRHVLCYQDRSECARHSYGTQPVFPGS